MKVLPTPTPKRSSEKYSSAYSPFPRNRYARPAAHYSPTWSNEMAATAVLGISPGTRVIGLAVIHNGELIEWRVKTFQESFSKAKMLAILEIIRRLWEYHDVGIVAIKKIDPLRSSPQLDRLMRNLVKHAKRHGVKVKLYSLLELDYDLQTGKQSPKGALAEQVAEKHAELRQAYLRERNNRKEYYIKMFEAVAIAELGYKKMQEPL